MIFKTGDRVVVGESKESPGLCGWEGTVVEYPLKYRAPYVTVHFSQFHSSLWDDARGVNLRHILEGELTLARPPTPLEVQVRAYIDQELCR